MIASIGENASVSQRVSYYETDIYYTKDKLAYQLTMKLVSGEAMGMTVPALFGSLERDTFERVLNVAPDR
ncbi:MAG: hypothetical protein OXC80_11315 [Gammaproteobacteria bacterium]|nr:hypothetical protein [Gammaproteobacteria bacterium]